MKTLDNVPSEQFEFGSKINEHGHNQQLHFVHNNDNSDYSLDSADSGYAPHSTFFLETSNNPLLEVPKNDLQWQSVVQENNCRNLIPENVRSIQKGIHSEIYKTTSENEYQPFTPDTAKYDVEFLPEEQWQKIDTSLLSDIFYQPISPFGDGTEASQDSSSMEELNKIILDLYGVSSNTVPRCVEKIEGELKRSENGVDFNGTPFVEFDQLSDWKDSSVENETSDLSPEDLVELKLSQKGASTTARARKRTFFSKSQLAKLEAHFSLNPYPSKEEIEFLGAAMDISDKRLRTWFQNKRQKISRRKKLLGNIYND